MKSLFDDLPQFCPSCGDRMIFSVVDRTAFFNGYALYCSACRHKYQYVARHVAEDRLADNLHPIFTAP